MITVAFEDCPPGGRGGEGMKGGGGGEGRGGMTPVSANDMASLLHLNNFDVRLRLT
jgi:hypothetical protein